MQEKSGFFWMGLVSEDGMVAVGAIGTIAPTVPIVPTTSIT